MFIIVKVKRKPLPGSLNSYLEQRGPYSSSREWNEHNFLYPLTKQRWGMFHCTATWAQHRNTCHHKLFLPLQTWMLKGLGCLFPDTWFIRLKISHKDACLSMCFCDVYHHGTQECLELLPFFQRESQMWEKAASWALGPVLVRCGW